CPTSPSLSSAASSACLLSAFSFQAEDGIRDRNVTGVQTCALPISCLNIKRREINDHMRTSFSHPPSVMDSKFINIHSPFYNFRRSEERRVGKEWRSQYAREHSKTGPAASVPRRRALARRERNDQRG